MNLNQDGPPSDLKLLCVLLAAGRGTRLAPLTDRLPKPALPILDVPLAAWGLAELGSVGAPIVVNTGASGAAIEAALAPFTRDRVEFLAEGDDPPGSGGTIASLTGRNAIRFLTLNADHLIGGLDLGDVLDTHARSGRALTLVVRAVPEGADLMVDGDHATRLIHRRRDPSAAGVKWLGVSVIEAGAIPGMPERRPIDLTAGLIAPLIGRDEVGIYVHRGYELDVGTPIRYLRACIDLMRGRAPRPPQPLRGTILEAGGGLAYVGPDGDAHPAAVGADAIVMAGARLPEGSFVTRGIVMPGEHLPAGINLENAIYFDGRVMPIRRAERETAEA